MTRPIKYFFNGIAVKEYCEQVGFNYRTFLTRMRRNYTIEEALKDYKKRELHGKRGTRLYETWQAMKMRTTNPKNTGYRIYGKRGIKVCEDWSNSFQTFYNWAIENGYKDNLTIDRIDVNSDYCPENCRWVDRHVQSANRRKQENITGYTGIGLLRNKKKYRYKAVIAVNKKNIRIGTFDSIKEAVDARNSFITKNNLKEYPLQEYKEQL